MMPFIKYELIEGSAEVLNEVVLDEKMKKRSRGNVSLFYIGASPRNAELLHFIAKRGLLQKLLYIS